MFFGIDVSRTKFRPDTPRAHLMYPWRSDMVRRVVVESGPNAAQAPRWVRNDTKQCVGHVGRRAGRGVYNVSGMMVGFGHVCTAVQVRCGCRVTSL